jgi:hypothetical protein
VSKEVAALLLFALAGFLIGGVKATWNSARTAAIVLAVLAGLAAAGAVAWLVS